MEAIKSAIVGQKIFKLKIADTSQSRAQGLMHIKSMPQDEGMLFVMDKSGPANFWMLNTHVPLDIVFLDHDFRVLKIDEMQPLVGKSSCESNVRYVIEVNQGQLTNAGVSIGDKIKMGDNNLTSAGFVIVDFANLQEPKALCLFSNWHIWGFPKGRAENDEEILETAYRETAEESGLTKEDFRWAGAQACPVIYVAGKDVKTAHYFFAERVSNATPWLPINPEIGKAEHIAWKWVPVSRLSVYLPKSLMPVIDDLERWCDEISHG